MSGFLDINCENISTAQPAAHCYVFLSLCAEVGIYLHYISQGQVSHVTLCQYVKVFGKKRCEMIIFWFFCRALIYPFLIRGGKPTPFVSFALAFLFCTYNGYMQIRYLSHFAEFPESWITDPYFIIGRFSESASNKIKNDFYFCTGTCQDVR